MMTTTTQSVPPYQSPGPNADDLLGSADAAALVFVNQQAATHKDERWHAEVSGANSRTKWRCRTLRDLRNGMARLILVNVFLILMLAFCSCRSTPHVDMPKQPDGENDIIRSIWSGKLEFLSDMSLMLKDLFEVTHEYFQVHHQWPEEPGDLASFDKERYEAVSSNFEYIRFEREGKDFMIRYAFRNDIFCSQRSRLLHNEGTMRFQWTNN